MFGLFLCGLTLAWGQSGTITLPRSLYESLQPLAQSQQAVAHGAKPWVARRDITLKPVQGGLVMDLRYTLKTQVPGVFKQAVSTDGLVIQSLTWNGRETALEMATKTKGARPQLVGWVEDQVTVVIRAWIPSDAHRRHSLVLIPALTGTVTLQDTSRRLILDGVSEQHTKPIALNGTHWTGAENLVFRLEKHRSKPTQRPLVGDLKLGMGLTVLEDEVVGQARLRWTLHSGRTDMLRLTVHDLPKDLTLTGPSVKHWTRSGKTLLVTLNKTTRHPVDIMLRWTSPITVKGTREFTLPVFKPSPQFSLQTEMQLASSGDLDVIPALGSALPVAADWLGPIGRDLIVAAPTSAFQAAGPISGHLTLYRYHPAEAPPVMVDVAASTVAMTEEGRTLARTRLTLRNERASHLTLCLAPGQVLLGLTVSGQPVAPQLAADCYRVPIPRSVDSVKGGIAFPIDVITRGEAAAFTVKDARTVSWLTVDAPIAVSRVTLYLPERYQMSTKGGGETVVSAFTEGEGMAYGYGLGGQNEAEADRLFQNALSDWMDNRFDDADDSLNQLKALGASNENIERLSANVEVVLEGNEPEPSADVSQSTRPAAKPSAAVRRIKEQARARARKDKQRQTDVLDEAEEAMAGGSYDQAVTLYKEAEVISQTLRVLEKSEAVEEVMIAQRVQSNLKKAKKKSRESKRDKSANFGTVSGVGSGGGGFGHVGAAQGMGVVPTEAPDLSVDFMDFDLEDGDLSAPQGEGRIAVASTAMDLVIPKRGEAVKYQQLLLEPGESPVLMILAQRPRRK